MGERSRPPARVLFVRTDRLGETLLNLPAVHVLRRAFPQAHLRFMVGASLEELLAGFPDVNEVIAEPSATGPWWRRAWQFSCLWRPWALDVVILSNPKKEYHLAAWMAGIPVRVGYDHKWSWCLTNRVPDDKRAGGRHEVEYPLELLRALGLSVSHAPVIRLPVSHADEERVVQRFPQLARNEEQRLIAVHPWTSNPRKRWPLARFRELIDRVCADEGATVVILGGLESRPQCSALAAEASPRVVDLVGRTSVRELAAVLRRVRVLVSNDSGPMHLAAAVGTPTVALFGTTDPAAGPARWGPWGPSHTVISRPAMTAIGVEEVLRGVRRHLASAGASRPIGMSG